uniref:F-box domain-containing protein n=1 Tax=Oryza glumipatula TaxID=40148 RepID=A0A0E0B7P9_9ORYZ
MNRLRHRRAISLAPPVTLPDDDDLLSEILLHLPPRPSSLPRASLVCKRWRRLVTDPAFHRRFRARHRNPPPLIGVFEDYLGYPFFRSVLDPPDLIPRERFRLRLAEDEGGQWHFYGCRHGRLLLFNRAKNEIVVWVPDTGDHRQVAVPPEIDGKEKIIWNGAVLSAATADDGPFRVVLVGVAGNNTQMFACVYCSESGKWSDLISFDLDKQTLSVIEWPYDSEPYSQTWLTEGDCLGAATLSRSSLQMWERKVCSGGVAKWVLQKTYELKNVLNPEFRLKIGGEMSHRRGRATSPAAPVTLPDDDDLLAEILLRLPPLPSSLPRASLVCNRWRRLVTDPAFHRRFRARHHRNPPIIGVFADDFGFPFFRSVMDPPDLIPRERFSMRLCEDEVRKERMFCGCRHGRVLLLDRKQNEIVLWDPDTGDHRRVGIPPEIDGKEKIVWNGAALCAVAAAADDDGHVHGGFSCCPFNVALVGVASNNTQMFACFYTSETGRWSNLIFTPAPFLVFAFVDPGILVGHSLYWFPTGLGSAILQFDLDRQTLAVIEWPSNPNCYSHYMSQIFLAEGGYLGLVTLSYDSLQIWERKVCSEGVTRWVLQRTAELNKVLELGSGVKTSHLVRLGYAEDVKVMLLCADSSVFMLQIDSLQSRKLWETNIMSSLHPYASTYVAANYGLRKFGKVSRLLTVIGKLDRQIKY